MNKGAASLAGIWVAFLAALLLFALVPAALGPARAHGALHAPDPARTEASADCDPHHPACQAAQHAACCTTAGCGTLAAALPRDHRLPDRAAGRAAFAPAAATGPPGTSAEPTTPPARHGT